MFEQIKDRVFELELAGETFQLIFDMNALAALEEKGVELANIDARAGGFSLARLVVWAGLRTYHRELTLEDVGARMLPTDLERVNRVIERALAAAFGQEEAPKGEDGGPEQVTGPPSTTGAADS